VGLIVLEYLLSIKSKVRTVGHWLYTSFRSCLPVQSLMTKLHWVRNRAYRILEVMLTCLEYSYDTEAVIVIRINEYSFCGPLVYGIV
jgi:hypothetical protein